MYRVYPRSHCCLLDDCFYASHYFSSCDFEWRLLVWGICTLQMLKNGDKRHNRQCYCRLLTHCTKVSTQSFLKNLSCLVFIVCLDAGWHPTSSQTNLIGFMFFPMSRLQSCLILVLNLPWSITLLDLLTLATGAVTRLWIPVTCFTSFDDISAWSGSMVLKSCVKATGTGGGAAADSVVKQSTYLKWRWAKPLRIQYIVSTTSWWPGFQ